MLKFLWYILLSIMIFIATIFITLSIVLVSGNMTKAREWWYEWTNYIEQSFNLGNYDNTK